LHEWHLLGRQRQLCLLLKQPRCSPACPWRGACSRPDVPRIRQSALAHPALSGGAIAELRSFCVLVIGRVASRRVASTTAQTLVSPFRPAVCARGPLSPPESVSENRTDFPQRSRIAAAGPAACSKSNNPCARRGASRGRTARVGQGVRARTSSARGPKRACRCE
jgi:hypothetical protein